MSRILVLNLAFKGHQARYTRWLLESEACNEAQLIVAGRKELFDHSELRGLAGRYQPHRVDISNELEKSLALTSTAGLVRRQFSLWRLWRQVYEQISSINRVNLVFLMNEDCHEAVSILGSPFGSTPWLEIVISPKFHFAKVGVAAPMPRLHLVREWFFRRTLTNPFLRGIFTIDPTLDEYASLTFSDQERRKMQYLPDPAVNHMLPEMEYARMRFEIREDSAVVLAYGMLSERKGIKTLIETAAMTDCPTNVVIVLAGEQTPEIAEYLTGEAAQQLEKQDRLRVINRYIDDVEEACLLATANCMWVAYRKFYTMSAILVLAGRHGIPAIVSDAGIAGYMMRKHQFGLAVDPDNHLSVLNALQEISFKRGQLVVGGQRAIAAFSRHSIFEFQKRISEGIRNATVS